VQIVVILIYLAIAANEAFFCDCYRNMGHFLCSLERIKHFVNVHLHCIVNNVPSKGRKYSAPPELLRSEISFLRTCNNPKHANKKLFERNVYFACILIRLYTYHIIHKDGIDWKRQLHSPKIIMLTKTNTHSV